MKTEKDLKSVSKRTAEKERQSSKKKSKTAKNREQLSETPPKTIHDLPAEVLESIFHFLDVESLKRAAQVCQFWQGASKRVKVSKFSSLLRTADRKETAGNEILKYLNQLGTFQANLPGPDNRYEIGIDEEENLLRPSLLHDLADWQPDADEHEIYRNIFYKLIELGANPSAVSKLEYIEESELVNTTEESVLDRAMLNGNQYMVFLLLELYPSDQLIVNEAKLLNRVINNFVEHDKLSSGVMANDHARIRDMYAKILNKMMECGFKPDFATIKKYWDQNIKIPTGQPSTFRNLNFLLFAAYPGEKNEEMLEKLRQENDLLKKQLEIAKQQLVALKQTNQETGKDEEVVVLPAAQL